MRDMLGRGQAVSVSEALKLLQGSIPERIIPELNVPLQESFGRVISRDVVSPEDLPGFSRSTVDGYAVLSGDTFGASETTPAYLNVTREILMGDEPGFRLLKGEAAKIATGGMLPEGADSVVMFEHVQVIDGGTIEVQRAVAPAENVIQRGEDVQSGQLIVSRGRRLRPHDVAVMAGAGHSEVYVYESPSIAIISTGDEVVQAGQAVKPGQVRDMNSICLAGMILEDGAIPVGRGIVRDEHEALSLAVQSALEENDVVLITGGSSVGVKDMTERVISELGEVLFHSVTMKPGKPMLAGICGGKPVLGLPGHPRAVAVCYEVFIRPVVEELSGLRPGTAAGHMRTVKARLARSISSAPGRQEVISVALSERDGEIWAEPVLGKSGLLSMMVKAEGTVTVPAEKPGIQQGQMVVVRLF
jgi:molybdopterin molybdotransferase